MKNAFIFSILILFSCNFDNKINTQIPIDSSLTKNILFKANQIIRDKENLIIVYNFSNRVETQDLYLLFFNSNLKLVQYTQFFSNKIETINNDTIFCLLNENKSNTRFFKSNRVLPFGYTLQMKESYSTNRKLNNKVIDEISFNKFGTSVFFKVRIYNTSIFSNRLSRYSIDSNYLVDNSKYKIKEFEVPLSELLFNFESEDIISMNYVDINNQFIREDFLFINKDQYTNFMNEIWNIIINK